MAKKQNPAGNPGTKHRMGPGRVEGAWWINRGWPDKRNRSPMIGFEAGVYIDNGMGNHGWLPVKGQMVPSSDVHSGTWDKPTAGVDFEEQVIEEMDNIVDEMIASGKVDEYFPGYTMSEFDEFEDNPGSKWHRDKALIHAWETGTAEKRGSTKSFRDRQWEESMGQSDMAERTPEGVHEGFDVSREAQGVYQRAKANPTFSRKASGSQFERHVREGDPAMEDIEPREELVYGHVVYRNPQGANPMVDVDISVGPAEANGWRAAAGSGHRVMHSVWFKKKADAKKEANKMASSMGLKAKDVKVHSDPHGTRKNPPNATMYTPGDGAGFGNMTSGTPGYNAGMDSEGARYARPYGHEQVKPKANPGRKNPARSLSDVKARNKNLGHHFFDRGNAPVVGAIRRGRYLITKGDAYHRGWEKEPSYRVWTIYENGSIGPARLQASQDGESSITRTFRSVQEATRAIKNIDDENLGRNPDNNPSFEYPPHSSPEFPGDGAGYGRAQSGAPSYSPGQSSTRNPARHKHVAFGKEGAEKRWGKAKATTSKKKAKKNPDRSDVRTGACPSCQASVVVPVGQSSGSCSGCGESLVVG